MTPRSPAHRFFLFGGSGIAIASAIYAGTPVWITGLSAVASALVAVLPQLVPQESEHRRDFWRDLFHHREAMKSLGLDRRGNEQHDRSPG